MLSKFRVVTSSLQTSRTRVCAFLDKSLLITLKKNVANTRALRSSNRLDEAMSTKALRVDLLNVVTRNGAKTVPRLQYNIL